MFLKIVTLAEGVSVGLFLAVYYMFSMFIGYHGLSVVMATYMDVIFITEFCRNLIVF